MNLDGRPLGLRDSIPITPFAVKIPNVGFDYSYLPDGSEAYFKILIIHPLFPLVLEIPFQQLFYLENVHEKLGELIENFKQAQETTS